MFEHFDDFTHFVDGDTWTMLDADSGSSVAEDADGQHGVVQLICATTDNNEAALATSNELFLFAADKSFRLATRIQYTEVNTDDANVAFGFADAFGANLITDDGAGVGIANSGVLIYKLDGGTVWRCNSENNGVSTDTVSTKTAGGSSYQTLEIVGRAVDGTNYELTFFCDGEPLRDSLGRPIMHRLAYASATNMDFGVYLKTGGAQTETLNVDYLAWEVVR